MIIHPGNHIHQTELGPFFVDVELTQWELAEVVREMKRRSLTPNDIIAASIEGNIVDFELRQPLSSD